MLMCSYNRGAMSKHHAVWVLCFFGLSGSVQHEVEGWKWCNLDLKTADETLINWAKQAKTTIDDDRKQQAAEDTKAAKQAKIDAYEAQQHKADKSCDLKASLIAQIEALGGYEFERINVDSDEKCTEQQLSTSCGSVVCALADIRNLQDLSLNWRSERKAFTCSSQSDIVGLCEKTEKLHLKDNGDLYPDRDGTKVVEKILEKVKGFSGFCTKATEAVRIKEELEVVADDCWKESNDAEKLKGTADLPQDPFGWEPIDYQGVVEHHKIKDTMIKGYFSSSCNKEKTKAPTNECKVGQHMKECKCDVPVSAVTVDHGNAFGIRICGHRANQYLSETGLCGNKMELKDEGKGIKICEKRKKTQK